MFSSLLRELEIILWSGINFIFDYPIKTEQEKIFATHKVFLREIEKYIRKIRGRYRKTRERAFNVIYILYKANEKIRE